jgi:5S rRNA maturation endonuclease (ribonuclease M5)
LIRGIISHQKYDWQKPGDPSCSFAEAMDYAQRFLNTDLSQIKISKHIKEKNNFTNSIGYINTKIPTVSSAITREHIIKNISIPASYYISRNYSTDILNKYDVGLCENPSKPMNNRVVVPIYDNDHKYMIGCTGRSIFEKCSSCNCFHNPKDSCPDDEKKWLFPKWKHSADFKSQNCLYNFWFAKDHIYDTGVAIIVESPGNVWRLEENNIHNSIAMFGSSLSDRQKMILDSSGAMTLIVLTDNDEAGKKAAIQIKTKCQNTYRVFIPEISKNDIGEMTSEEINNEIKEYIKKIS